MKKNIFILGAFAVAALFTACQKDEITTPTQEPAGNLTEITINAEFPEFVAEKDTRTQLAEDGASVLFNKGDKILTMPHAKDLRYEFTNVTETGSSATFTGMVDLANFNTTVHQTDRELFIYPAVDGVTFYQSYGWLRLDHLYFPAAQKLTPNSYDPKANIAVGVYDVNGEIDTPIEFKNICGLLGLALKGDAKIKSIAITAPDGARLGGVKFGVTKQGDAKNEESGGSHIDFLKYKFEGTVTGPGSNTITLTADTPIDLTTYGENGVKFYACVMPRNNKDYHSYWQNNVGDIPDDESVTRKVGAIPGGYKVVITDENGLVLEKVVTLTGLEGYDGVVTSGGIRVLGKWKITEDMFENPTSLAANALPAFVGYTGEASNVAAQPWKADDKVLLPSNMITPPYTLTNVATTGDGAKFLYTDVDMVNFSNSNHITYLEYFVYPKSNCVSATVYHPSLTVSIPAEQTLTPGSYDPKASVAIAAYDINGDWKTTAMDFKYFNGLLGVTLKGNAEVEWIKITCPEAGNISGEVGFSKEGGYAFDNTYRNFWYVHKHTASETSKSVTLTATTPVALTEAGATFYACVVPRYHDGLEKWENPVATEIGSIIYKDASSMSGAMPGMYTITVKTVGAEPVDYTVDVKDVIPNLIPEGDYGNKGVITKSDSAVFTGHARVIAEINVE